MLVTKFPGHRVHFIEDRVETLQKVASTPGLETVQLYLAGNDHLLTFLFNAILCM